MRIFKGIRPASAVRAVRRQEGFTIIEVVVAFSVLSIMALAALPLLMLSLKYTSTASTTTAANQRVQMALEDARKSPVTCTSLLSNVATKSYTDGRGKAFTVQLSLPSGCTASASSQAVPLKIVAKRTVDNKVLSTVTSYVFVSGS